MNTEVEQWKMADAEWLKAKSIKDHCEFLERRERLLVRFPFLKDRACFDDDAEIRRRLLETTSKLLKK